MFTQDCNFIFIPVDKDFNSMINNLETSDTSFPSELDLKGIAGFLLIPAFLDTKEILFSPWMKTHETADIKGHMVITANPDNDGIIMMNWDPTKKDDAPVPKGVTVVGSVQFKKTATVPGFQQNYVVYLKTGTAFIFEKLLIANEWYPEYVGAALVDSVRKLGNAYPSNKTLAYKSWDGLSGLVQFLKWAFGASSSTIGYQLNGVVKSNLEVDVFELMSDAFYEDPTYFASLKFDAPIIESMKEKAQKSGQNEFFEHLSKL